MQNVIKNENEHQQETIIQLKNTKQTVKSNLKQILWHLLFSTVPEMIHPLSKIPQCPVIRHFGINWDYTLGSSGLLFFSDTCAKAIGLLQAQR